LGALFFERRGHFSTVQICRRDAALKPASRGFAIVFVQKPVQIAICFEHPRALSNPLAATPPMAQKSERSRSPFGVVRLTPNGGARALWENG
jgi:hypothetical protein